MVIFGLGDKVFARESQIYTYVAESDTVRLGSVKEDRCNVIYL